MIIINGVFLLLRTVANTVSMEMVLVNSTKLTMAVLSWIVIALAIELAEIAVLAKKWMVLVMDA